MSPKVLTGSASNISHQTLDQGALLFNSDENTVVDTPFGSVNLAAGSFALLVAFEDGLGVYDLHDGHKGAVAIKFGSENTMLSPGQSAMITKSSAKTFEQLNPTQFVAYRKVINRTPEKDLKLFRAEFDLGSMLHGLKPLRDMLASDSPKTRKAITNMLKTAAIMSSLTQGGESFAFQIAPPVTAYAPEINR